MTTNPLRSDSRPPGVDSGEKQTLVAFLDYARTAVATKAQGLDAEQAHTPGVPSGTSVLGLVKHLTAAELYWFAWAYEGADVTVPDFGMDLDETETAESLLAAYRAAITRSAEIVERCDDLNRPCARAADPDAPPRSLRWVLVHMIGETSRHAGHADILREQLDGSTGR